MKIKPIITPGSESGRMTSRKTLNGDAPRSFAASTALESIAASWKNTGVTMNSTYSCTSVRLTAKSEYSRKSNGPTPSFCAR